MLRHFAGIVTAISLTWDNPSFAQESNARINDVRPAASRSRPSGGTTAWTDEGKVATYLKHAWAAQWITHPTASTVDYGVFMFRRKFELAAAPAEFVVYVSADNRYRLYVNGRPAGLGPARGDISHYRYETIDLAPLLRKGDNVVAAEVVNFGEHRHMAQQSFQTAFILQGKDEAGVVDTGAGHWKVARNDAYSPLPFSTADLQGYYAAGPGDEVDASKYPWGWQSLEFDDRLWLAPRTATVEFAVGRGFLYGSTWFLVPRTIAFLEETPQVFPRLVRAAGLAAGDGFLRGAEPLVVPPRSRATLLLDQTHHTIGYPQLTISGGAGGEVKITYAEALFDDRHQKGNRNETEGKQIHGYYDLIRPDGGDRRAYRPLAQRTYRFVQFDIATADDPLTIVDYHGVYTAYPLTQVAQFECDDPNVNDIWAASWRTLRNSSVDGFIDPYYEQMQYIGDARIEALASLVVSGDDRLMRNAIAQFDDSRIPEGLTQSRYPAYAVQVIPPYSLLWIGMLHDHYRYCGDLEFLRPFAPGMRNVLEWFDLRIDETGLPTDLRWWNFTDWSPGFKNGIPPGADDGHSSVIALQYVAAAAQASELFAALGWNAEAEKYRRSAADVRSAVYARCFDADRGLVADTPDKESFSQHAQILAVLADAAPTSAHVDLLRRSLAEPELAKATIYFRYYLFQAMGKAGLGDDYLSQLGPWRDMLDMGLTTFAEKDVAPRSDCHAWSASPSIDLLRIVAGVSPGEPGFRSVEIEPHLGQLTHVKARAPHPAGVIDVEYRRIEGSLHGEVTLPPGVSGTFRWKNRPQPLRPGRQTILIDAEERPTSR
jgi:hypothetical protein